jgi:ABC-type multidrug transport system fused ATPase/permease subunit
VRIRRRHILRSRRGALDAGIIILGIIVSIVAIVAATLTWSDVLEVSYVNLITDMPKFEYDIEGGQESGNRNFEIYQILRNIALAAFVIVLMFAGLSFVFEHVNLVAPQTGYNIISKGLIFTLIFFFFPPLWDLLATTIQHTALWILNPEEPGQPTKNISYLLNKIGGGIECHPEDESCNFTLDRLVAGITDPFTSLRNMFLTTFLAVFKAIAFLIFMFLTFLLGTIRIVFTAIVTIAIPLILVISLLPVFRRVANRLIDAFLGLMIAPLFSALGIVAGVAHLQTFVASSPDPIVEWFAALAVMGLVTFIPAMIVPMLGSVLHSVSSIVSNTIAASSIVGGAAATSLNIAAGTMSVLQRAGGASISGIHLARTAISNSFGISGNAANSIATHFSGNDVNSRR